jgi:transcriptional regulator with XRE-family HTH domain
MLTAQVRNRLLALRTETGLSETALARAAGQVQQEVNRFFTGDMKLPKLDFLDSMARVFHYTLADLLAKDMPPRTMTKQELTILVNLQAMKPSDRLSFENLISRDKKSARI